MSETPEQAGLVRMPNGVMDYLENGADVVEVAEAEAKSAVGDPRSYERARARLEDPNRKSSVRYTGTPILTSLFRALAATETDSPTLREPLAGKAGQAEEHSP
jgi:hypothetical protein